MKHRVSDLEGALLDAAVCQALGMKTTTVADVPEDLGSMETPSGFSDDAFQPSLCWDHGGPIIERERIATWASGAGWGALLTNSQGLGGFYDSFGGIGTAIDVNHNDGMAGPTPLVAAMRAYVASKLGEEIELP